MNTIDIYKVDELVNIKKTLIEIASTLNSNNINWGLGGSLLLFLYGINTTVADIDIVIDEKDIDKVESFISSYNKIEIKKSDIFLTDRLYTININSVDIDLMIGFKILTEKGVYIFPKGGDLAYKTVLLDNTKINICSLEDWLDAYTAMKRIDKVELINKLMK